MTVTAQTRALNRYRDRLAMRGMSRFEVLGLDQDRELIRALAKKLAESGQEANQIRARVAHTVAGASQRGGILAALRRSPFAGAEIRTVRPRLAGRKIDL